MRRLLLAIAVAIIYCYAAKFLVYLALRSNFSMISFDLGFWMCLILYVIIELILNVKNRVKGGTVADIKITVKDASDPEQVGEAIKTGIQTFDVLRKMGNRTKELISEKISKKKPEDENPKEEV